MEECQACDQPIDKDALTFQQSNCSHTVEHRVHLACRKQFQGRDCPACHPSCVICKLEVQPLVVVRGLEALRNSEAKEGAYFLNCDEKHVAHLGCARSWDKTITSKAKELPCAGCEKCPIDLEPFDVGEWTHLPLKGKRVVLSEQSEKGVVVGCGHLFKEAFLAKAVKRVNKCPLCRATIKTVLEAVPDDALGDMDQMRLEGLAEELNRGGELAVPEQVSDEEAAYLLQRNPDLLILEDGFLRQIQPVWHGVGHGPVPDPVVPSGLQRLFGSLAEMSEAQLWAFAGGGLIGAGAVLVGYGRWRGAPVGGIALQQWIKQFTAAELRAYRLRLLASGVGGLLLGTGFSSIGFAVADQQGPKGRWVKRWVAANGVFLLGCLSLVPPFMLWNKVNTKLYGVNWIQKVPPELPWHAGLVMPLGLLGAIVGSFGFAAIFLIAADDVGRRLPQNG